MTDTQTPKMDTPSASSIYPSAAWSGSKLPSLQYNFQVITCVQQIKPDKIHVLESRFPTRMLLLMIWLRSSL